MTTRESRAKRVKEMHTQTGMRLWLMWVVATGIGSLAAYIAGALALSLFLFPDLPPVVGWPILEFIVGAAAGATLGALQWLILRPWVTQGPRWVLVTALGAAVALTASTPLHAAETPILYGVLLGVSLGVFQGLVASRRRMRSLLWLLVSIIAWTLGASVLCICALGRFLFEQAIPYEVLVVIAGAIAGSITGGAVVWLVYHSRGTAFPESKEQTV